MSDRWNNFGYPTDKPCDVCGEEGDNKIEPRFMYVICEEHSKLSPVQVGDAIERNVRKNG